MAAYGNKISVTISDILQNGNIFPEEMHLGSDLGGQVSIDMSDTGIDDETKPVIKFIQGNLNEGTQYWKRTLAAVDLPSGIRDLATIPAGELFYGRMVCKAVAAGGSPSSLVMFDFAFNPHGALAERVTIQTVAVCTNDAAIPNQFFTIFIAFDDETTITYIQAYCDGDGDLVDWSVELLWGSDNITLFPYNVGTVHGHPNSVEAIATAKGVGTYLVGANPYYVDRSNGNLMRVTQMQFASGGSNVDIVRDEDTMSSNDANALATQQSIKAYVETRQAPLTRTFGQQLNLQSTNPSAIGTVSRLLWEGEVSNAWEGTSNTEHSFPDKIIDGQASPWAAAVDIELTVNQPTFTLSVGGDTWRVEWYYKIDGSNWVLVDGIDTITGSSGTVAFDPTVVILDGATITDHLEVGIMVQRLGGSGTIDLGTFQSSYKVSQRVQ